MHGRFVLLSLGLHGALVLGVGALAIRGGGAPPPRLRIAVPLPARAFTPLPCPMQPEAGPDEKAA